MDKRLIVKSLRGVLALLGVVAALGGASAGAQPGPAAPLDPNEKVAIPANCQCSAVLGIFRDRCLRKNLICPTTDAVPAGTVRLTDFIVKAPDQTYATLVSSQTAYGRLKVTLEGGEALQSALTRTDSPFRRFMPQARGIIISVAARSSGGGAVLEVLPTTPIAALDVPLPGAAGNVRNLVTRTETRSAWVRLDSGTSFDVTLRFDSVSDQKFQFFDQTIGRISAAYSRITGDQSIGGMSAVAIGAASQEIDGLIDYLVDPDGADTRKYTGEGLSIQPVQGGRKSLVFEIRDDQDFTRVVGQVVVEVELAPTLIRPAVTTDPAQLTLQAVPLETQMRNAAALSPTGTPTTFGARAEYGQLLAQLQAGSATAAGITGNCMAFRNNAIGTWGVTPIDASLLIYEALDEARRLVGTDPARQRVLAEQQCLSSADIAALKTLGRGIEEGPAAKALLTPIDLGKVGLYLIAGTAIPDATLARFADEVELVSSVPAFGFEGSFSAARDEVLAAIADKKPVRYCCFSGASETGRIALVVDMAAAGSAANPMVVETQTVGSYDRRAARIILRAPTAEELGTIKGKWTSPSQAANR